MNTRLPALINLLVLLFANFSIAQTNAADSLRSIIRNTTGNDKTNAQIEFLRLYSKSQHYDSTLQLAFKIKKSAMLWPKREKGGFLHQIGYAQYQLGKYDSAKFYFQNSQKVLADVKSESQGMNYLNLGAIEFYYNNFDTAAILFDRAIEIFYAIGDTSNAIKGALNKSLVQGRLGKPIDQIKGLSAILKRLSKKDWKGRMITFTNLGTAYCNASLNDSCSHYFFKALKIAQKYNDSTSQSIYLANLSQAYSNLGLSAKALFYSRKALKLNKKINRKKGVAYSLFAIARVKLNQKELDSAKHYYFQCLSLPNIDDYDLKGVCLSNLGNIQMLQGLLDSAYYYLKLAESELRSQNYLIKLAAVYNGLAEVSWLLNRSADTKQYLDSAYKYSFNHGSFAQIANYYGTSLLINASKGALFQSRKDLENYTAYSDSAINEESSKYALFMSQLYEDEVKKAALKELKQKNEIAELELSKANLKTRNLIIILSLVFLLVLIIAWSLMVKRRSFSKLQIANNQVENQNAQLEVLNKEIYHRAKNNLQTISSLLGLQQHELVDEKAKELLTENQNRINTMSMINRRLFAHNKIQDIDFIEFMNELKEELEYVFNIDKHIIQITTNQTKFLCNDKMAIPLGLMANEIITNAIKYGCTNAKPKIEVSFLRVNDTIEFAVKDNGSGFINQSRTESFGNEMIEMMAEQLNAGISRKSNEGAQVIINFNLKHLN